MLDGIRRRLKKTGSSLSVSLSISPSILNSWGGEREICMEKKIERLMESERWMEGFPEKDRVLFKRVRARRGMRDETAIILCTHTHSHSHIHTLTQKNMEPIPTYIYIQKYRTHATH